MRCGMTRCEEGYSEIVRVNVVVAGSREDGWLRLIVGLKFGTKVGCDVDEARIVNSGCVE